MNHEEYKKAIEKDREYAFTNLEQWQAKEKEAMERVEYWTRQVEAMKTVEARVGLFDNSAFYSKTDS